MSLLRRAGRVAVASSIHGSVQQRQRSRWAAQAEQQAPTQPAPVAQSASPVPGPSTGASPVDPAQRIALLKDLAELHAAGVLTDAEFSAQKAALLA